MKKNAEYRGMSDEQLALTLKEVTKNLFHLRVQSATERLETPSEIRKAKREVARILTVQRERTLKVEREQAERQAAEEKAAKQKAWVEAVAARKKNRADAHAKAATVKQNKGKPEKGGKGGKKSESAKGK
jgi:large subunit ribosomal protein L29